MEMIGWGAGIVYGNPDHLIVFISGYGRPDQQQFHFLRYADPFPQTKLFLRDHGNCQFEQGISGVTVNEEENIAFLRFMIERIGARRVTFVSGSLGSHPTVIWGHTLGVQDIHLIGPVTDMVQGLTTDRITQPAFLPVADHFRRKIAEGYPHLSLRAFMRDHADAVDCVDLYYGREDPIDSAQAAVIQDLPQVRTTLYHQGDHFRVPMFVQRRDTDLSGRIMAPVVARPADLRKAGQTAPVELGYAAVRLM